MEKLKYERPTIIRHMTGIANKLSQAQALRTKKEIDGVAVKDLVAQFGSPVFIFSETAIRKRYRDAHKAFSVRYPKIRFAWSYKTNYLDAVCRIYHQEGSWAEVVSEYEYEMAKQNGIPGEKIIYNGPYKPESALLTAVQEGAMIHLDHFDELYALEEIAAGQKRPINVGMRVNMDTGIYPSWDRFGFNLDNGEAMNAARRIIAGGKLTLTGLHAHIGTFIIDTTGYRNATAKLAALARDMDTELGILVEYIDVGGGFASVNTLHEQYAPGKDVNPPIEVYAESITSAMLEAGFPTERLPTLILETGRALIDESGYLLTSVVSNKRLPNGVRSLIIDAGTNILFTSFWYKHEIMLTDEKEGLFEETVIYGPLCMNIDVIRPSIRLPALDPKDLLVIHPVGAYNLTQWMQFIRMRPAVVLIGKDGGTHVIRDAETLETVKSPEHIPDHLK